MYQTPIPSSPVNRYALISLSAAMLALFSFCIGAIPLPLTALVCYPFSMLLGLTALWTGLVALRIIRQNGERGRILALIGIWVGSLTLLFVVCAVSLVIALWPSFTAYIQQIINQMPK